MFLNATNSTSNTSTTNYIRTTNTASTLIGGWAIWGTNAGLQSPTDFAFQNTLNTTAPTYNTDTWATGDNDNVTAASANITNNTNTLSLRYNTTTASTITLAGTSQITSGGILLTNLVGTTSDTITGGTLEGATGADLVVNQYAGTSATPSTYGTLTINSVIANATGATALTKTGFAPLVLGGNNTFTGGLFVDEGAVILNNAGALNSTAPNTVTFGNSNATTVLTQSLSLNGNSVTISGLNTSAVIGATTTTPILQDASAANANATLTINSSTSGTYGGTIQNGSGSGVLSLVKSGSSAQTLTGSLTYTGFTTVNSGGTLAISNASATVGTTTSGYEVEGTLDVSNLNSGALNFTHPISGAGTIKATTVATSSTLAPGAGLAGQGNTGSLTLTGNLTLSAGAVIQFGLNNTNSTTTGSSNSYINIQGGALNLPAGAGAVTLDLWTPGSTTSIVPVAGQTNIYDLFALTSIGTGTFSGATNAFGLTNPAGFKSSFAIANGFLQLTLTPSGTAGVWNNGSTDGQWTTDGVGGNWSGGLHPGVAGDSATFDSANTAPGTVNLNAPESLGNLTFNNGGWTISSNNSSLLTMDGSGGGAAISSTGNNTVSTAIALNDNTIIGQAPGGTLGLSGIISNSSATPYSLKINGAGTTVLGGANTYGPAAGTVTGGVLTPSIGTTVSGGGTVQLGSGSALGLGDVAVTGASSLQAGAATIAAANNILLTNGVALTVDNNGDSLTLSGVITDGTGSGGGTGSLALIGSGTTVLAGINTYAGGTKLSAGTVQITSSASLGNASGALTFNGGTLQLAATIPSSTRNFVVSASQTAIFDTQANNGTFSGNISGLGTSTSGSADGLTKKGSGNLTLSGTGTYTGQTSISQGIITTGAVNSLIMQDSTLNTGATLGVGGSLAFGTTTTAATLAGLTGVNPLVLTNTNATAAPVTLTIAGGAISTYNGTLSGLGSLIVNGTGAVTMGSAATGGGGATYSGNTTLATGNLTIGGTSSLSGGNLAVGTTGPFNLTVADSAVINSKAAVVVGAVSGATGTWLIENSATVTVPTSLTLSNNVGTAPAVTLTLQNSAALTVTGDLILDNGAGSSAVTNVVNLNGGTLAVNDFIEQTVHLSNINFNGGLLEALQNTTAFLPNVGSDTALVAAGGAFINPNTFAITIAQPLLHGSGTPDGGLTLTASGTLTLNGASTYTGGTTVNAGTLIAGINNATTVSGAFGPSADKVTLGAISGTANASVLTGGAFTVSNPITVAAGSSGNTLTIGGNTDNNSTFSGVVTLNNNLTVSQSANVGTNALSITGGITAGSIAPESVTFAGPGNIIVSTGVLADNAGAPADTLSVNVTGGTTTLTSANTYTGATTIGNGATLQLGDGTTGHDGSIANTSGITDSGTLIYNRFGAQSSSRIISGGGAVVISGPGSQSFTASNSYSGATTINAGASLILGDGTTDGSIGGTSGVTNSGTLVYNLHADRTVNYAITAAGANPTLGNVTLNGPHNLTLTNVTNSYGGTTTITGGTLFVNNASGSGTGASAVNVNGGTLSGTGSASGAVMVAGGATVSPGIGSASNTLSTGAVTSTGTGSAPATASNFSFTINSNNTLSNDELVSSGVVNLGDSASTFSLLSVTDIGSAALSGGTFVLINSPSNPIQGTFFGLAEGAQVVAAGNASNTYTISYQNDEVTLSDVPGGGTSVPEPGSVGVLALGGLVLMRRRRRAIATASLGHLLPDN